MFPSEETKKGLRSRRLEPFHVRSRFNRRERPHGDWRPSVGMSVCSRFVKTYVGTHLATGPPYPYRSRGLRPHTRSRSSKSGSQISIIAADPFPDESALNLPETPTVLSCVSDCPVRASQNFLFILLCSHGATVTVAIKLRIME